MLFFKKKATVRKHRSTAEQIEAKTKALEKRLATEELAKMVKENPDFRRLFVEKSFGFSIPKTDLTAESIRKAKELFIAEGLKLVEADPELKKEFARRYLEQTMGFFSGNEERMEENSNDGSSPSGDVHDIVDEFLQQKLEEKLLGESGGSGIGSFLNPAVLAEFFRQLPIILGRAPAADTFQHNIVKTYVVVVDGKITEVSEPDYRRLVREGRISPLGAPPAQQVLEDGKEGTPTPVEPDTTEDKPTDVRIPSSPGPGAGDLFLALIDTAAPLLDLPPDEVVAELRGFKDSGEPFGPIAWEFLRNNAVETIAAFIAPYRNDPRFTQCVARLMSPEGQAWLNEVITSIKGVPNT